MAFPFTSSTLNNNLHFLLLFWSLTVFCPLCIARKCHPDDEAGLLAFKSGITKDQSGTFNTWRPGSDCCIWFGLGCINSNRVTNLDIDGGDSFYPNNTERSLFGTISPLLFIKVRQLSRISIDRHPYLTGSLPKELFNLPNLRYLHITGTNLSGQLYIGTKSNKIVDLDLSGNQFTGSIPNSISQLTYLTKLNLDRNKLTGKIPYAIGNLKLTYLHLGNNKLSGGIPDFFKSFALTELYLSYNQLSGGIPHSLAFLAPQLEVFWVGHNKLTGRIPDYLRDFKKLIALDLSYNRLSGPIPKIKFPVVSFEGNANLCGSPLPPCKKLV